VARESHPIAGSIRDREAAFAQRPQIRLAKARSVPDAQMRSPGNLLELRRVAKK